MAEDEYQVLQTLMRKKNAGPSSRLHVFIAPLCHRHQFRVSQMARDEQILPFLFQY